jgi:hypothetical protein
MIAIVNYRNLCLLAVAIGFGLSSMASAAEQTPSAPAQKPVQVVNPSVNAVTQAAVNAGALSCASRINQVINFLATGNQGIGARLYMPAVEPDRKLISVSLEVQNENIPSAYASASFAPNQANGCGAVYEAVMYWNMKCDNVAVKQFAGLKQIGAMRKEITMLDGGPDLKVFLMPAGSGCISIKKEVVQ